MRPPRSEPGSPDSSQTDGSHPNGKESVNEKESKVHILGIDIAKASFKAGLTEDNQYFEQESFNNDSKGFKRLAKWLDAH